MSPRTAPSSVFRNVFGEEGPTGGLAACATCASLDSSWLSVSSDAARSLRSAPSGLRCSTASGRHIED